MTITIGSNNRSFRNIKAQYIAMACGIALAAAAVVVGASWNGESNRPAVTSVRPPAGISASQPAASQQFVYYLVGNDAEALRLEGSLANRQLRRVSPVTTRVLVVNSVEQKFSCCDNPGTGARRARLPDYRPRSQPVAPAPAATEEFSVPNLSAQLDSDILASVISTEKAAYDFDTAPEASSVERRVHLLRRNHR
jgi:hypothetical protein